MIPTKASIPEEHEPLVCTVDFEGWSLAPPCLSNVSGTRAPSVPAELARTLRPEVALDVKVRPSAQATTAGGSSTTKGWAASLDSDHPCHECDGTGWVLYRTETKDGEFEEAYRLCSKGHSPRYCMGSSSGQLCSRPATVRCGKGYYCKEHVAYPRG